MEALVAILMLSLLVVLVTAIIALFRPLPQFWLPEKRRAAIVAAGSFVLLGGVAQLAPDEMLEPPVQAVQQTAPEEPGFINYRAELTEQFTDPCLFHALLRQKRQQGTYRGDEGEIWQQVEWEKRTQSHLIDRIVRAFLPVVRGQDAPARQRWYTTKRMDCAIDDKGTTLGQFLLGTEE